MSTPTPEELRVEELKLQIATLREERADLQTANEVRYEHLKEQRRRTVLLTRSATTTVREGYVLFGAVAFTIVAGVLSWAGVVPKEVLTGLSYVLLVFILQMSYKTRLNRKRQARWDKEDRTHDLQIAVLEKSLSKLEEEP